MNPRFTGFLLTLAITIHSFSWASEPAIPRETRIARAIDPLVEAHPGETGIYLLHNGLGAFLARLAAIETAEESIELQYFIFKNDTTGRLLMERLLAAADRGVKVRLLIDDLGKQWRDRYLVRAAAHPNLEIRLFNPPVRIGQIRPIKFFGRLIRIHRRMHNKLFVADGKYAIIGGRNLGDEYFDASKRTILDLDAIVIGDAVPQLMGIFEDYWDFHLSVPIEEVSLKSNISEEEHRSFRERLRKRNFNEKALIYIDQLKTYPLMAEIRQEGIPFQWGIAKAVADQPEKLNQSRYIRKTHLTQHIEPYTDLAKKELTLVSPYFIPGKRRTKALRKIAESGVDVTVITNSLSSNNHWLVHAAYMKYRKRLLKSGVKLLESKAASKNASSEPGILQIYKNSLLHTKLFLVDRRYVLLGSFNLDPRSRILNTELILIFESPKLAENIAMQVKEISGGSFWELALSDNKQILWHDSKNPNGEIRTTEPGTTWLDRQGLRLLQLLPIEQQL